eukprot:TRINITY_DN2943_c0_g1_i1.p1 TRINITY_DN2943_c0_g1~~TRINITY_DN2943_c0_g1_i1.p1  ORF type:complete len:218 (+),score=36.07 TRINITY_DN2943_c0_g1_i1:176-829(+)
MDKFYPDNTHEDEDVAEACGERPEVADPFSQLWLGSEGDEQDHHDAAETDGSARSARSLAPFRACRLSTARKALAFGDCQRSDVVADVGCGDGRLLSLAVAECGVRGAVGVEMDARVCVLARARRGLAFPTSSEPWVLIEADACTVDWKEWTLLVLYLLPEGLGFLRARIEEWLQGSAVRRCVCIQFPITSFKPTRVDNSIPLFLYTADSIDRKQSP